MAQGFVQSLNLFESQDGDSARGILNNLAGAGIATDVSLFANNLRTFNFVSYTDFVASAEPYPVQGEQFYSNVNPELNTDGDFDNNPIDSWLQYNPNQDLIGTVTVSGGKVDISTSSQSAGDIENGFALYQHVTVTPGETYTVELNRRLLEEPTNGVATVSVKVFDAPGFTSLNTEQTMNVGFNTFNFTPTAATVTFAIHVVGGDASIDDVSTKLQITLDPADFDYLVIPSTVNGAVPLSNGTRLYQIDDDGTTRLDYEVVDSNALDRFRLKRVIGGVVQSSVSAFDEFYNKTNKTFYIELPVTFQNLTSFSVSREELNDGSGGSGETTQGEGVGTLEDLDNETGADAGAPATNITFLKTNDLAELQGEIDAAVDTFYYKEGRTIVAYKDNYFDRLIELNGVMYIANDTDIPYNDDNKNTMPGLFIVAHGEAVRAFSDTNNPWDTGNLTTGIIHPVDSTITIDAITTVEPVESAAVLNLIYEGPNPTLYTTESTNIVTTPAFNVQNNWTHKMPATINGQPFFLLLSENDPSTI